jgi:two-component system, OmpR family, sensor histidine kinase VicK
MIISFKHARRFTEDEIDWATQAAELIALAIAKAQAYAELEDRVAERTVRLRAANERLTELSRLKDEFVSNVSHELRTPITSIKLYHHLLATRADKHDEYLTRLDRETKRLENIVEDLLALSRLDKNRGVLNEQPFDMNTLAQQHVEDREALAEDRGLELVFQSDPELPPVRGDRALLGQVLSVILTNAMNYTPRGGRIVVGTAAYYKKKRQWVSLSVSDNGPGISSEDMPRLFQRFFRGRAGVDSWTAGTGLGLALAREIVERHGGHITAKSPGQGGTGATFEVWLRAAD